MHNESDQQMLTERDVELVFNLGLQTAIFILEKAEELSAEGRRFLIEELKKKIGNNKKTGLHSDVSNNKD